MRHCLRTTAVLFLASLLAVDVPAVVPTSATTPSGIAVTINNGPGVQTAPHVSQNLAAYMDSPSGQIRYYNFLTTADLAISNVTPSGEIADDFLPDVYNNSVVFTRNTFTFSGQPGAVCTAQTCVEGFDITLFDTVSSTVTTIDPSSGGCGVSGGVTLFVCRLSPGIGENTIAYIDYGLPGDVGSGEIVAHDIAANTATRLTNDGVVDQNPQVAPNGNVIVWETCPSFTTCDISQAVRTGTTWTVSSVASTPDSENNPDTDGTNVVYESNRATSVAGRDIYFRLVDGGPETQLEIVGFQSNPSIAAGIIAFQSAADSLSANDLYVYRISSNQLFQVTNTPGVSEQLNDITVLPTGEVRLVWAADGADILGVTIQLPPPPTSCLNRTATLTATMNYRPSISRVDGAATMVPEMTFAMPASIPVTAGNAGVIGMATLAFKNAQCAYAVRCRYKSAGSKYNFASCSVATVKAGTLVTATDLRLRVNLGNFLLPKTTAQAVLTEGCSVPNRVCGVKLRTDDDGSEVSACQE